MPGNSHEPGLGRVSVHLVSASQRHPPRPTWSMWRPTALCPGQALELEARMIQAWPGGFLSDHVDLGHRHMALETLLGVPVWAGTHLIFHLGLWSQRKYLSRQSRGQGILPAKSPAALAPALTSS